MKVLNHIELVIQYVKKNFWKWFAYTITTSLIALVTCSLVFDKDLQLAIINSWVGIVLGLVALVATIFSMALSFYNLEKQNELNAQNDEMLKQILTLSRDTNNSIRYGSTDTHDLAGSKMDNDIPAINEFLQNNTGETEDNIYE